MTCLLLKIIIDVIPVNIYNYTSFIQQFLYLGYAAKIDNF